MEKWHIKPRIGRRLDVAFGRPLVVPRSPGLQLEVCLWEAHVGLMRARRMQVRRLGLMWVWRGLIGIWRPSERLWGRCRWGRRGPGAPLRAAEGLRSTDAVVLPLEDASATVAWAARFDRDQRVTKLLRLSTADANPSWLPNKCPPRAVLQPTPHASCDRAAE